jgi:ParB-like nuclease domain
MKVDITLIIENPMNREIYGEEDPFQFAELIEKIKASGYIKPLVINRNYLLLSGHRRYRAALQLGRTEVEVEMFKGDDDKELEILLNENAFREKTTLQKVREAEFYHQIEEKKAEERQFFGTNLTANLQYGETNAIVGEKIGMSARSYHDARKVVQKIDEEEDTEVKAFLEGTLNKSVNAATKFIDIPSDTIKEVIDQASGDTKNACILINEIDNAGLRNKSNLPGGKFQCIYLDLSQPFKNLAQLPLQDVGSQDSVLFLWVTPTKLESAFPLIRKWCYKYKTCMLWDIMQNRDVSDYGEILLIATKGRINLMIETKDDIPGPEKPRMVKNMIMNTYSGEKLEILSDGWQIWSNEEIFDRENE